MTIRHCTRFLVVLLLLSGCGFSAKLTSSWVEPTMRGYVVRDVLVVAVSPNEASRKLWEMIFAEHFRKASVRAVESNRLIGDVPQPGRDTLEAAIRKAGVSSVLITHVVDSSSETHTFPGTVHLEPRASFNGLYGYYGSVYQAVYTPPVDTTRTRVRLESNLYFAGTARLVWTGRSEAVDAGLLHRDFDRIIGLLINDLRKNGLLPAKRD